MSSSTRWAIISAFPTPTCTRSRSRRVEPAFPGGRGLRPRRAAAVRRPQPQVGSRRGSARRRAERRRQILPDPAGRRLAPRLVREGEPGRSRADRRAARPYRRGSGEARMTRLILRELRLSATGGAALLPLVFFLLVATLFPFAVGPDGPLLARTGGGALWMAALLAALLPIDRLVEPDRSAGVLDQLALSGISEEAIAFAKLAGHWLSFAPPLMLAAIPGAALLKLPAQALVRLEIGLLIGTPGLAALTLGVAALTAGLRRGGALAGLLVLPLAVPLLIFGAGYLERGNESGALQLLGAVSLLLVAGAPFAAGAAIRALRD